MLCFYLMCFVVVVNHFRDVVTGKVLVTGDTSTCDASMSCGNQFGKTCSCDPECATYGNCCPGFVPNDDIHDPTRLGRASCYQVYDIAELYVDSCPITASVDEVERCERSLMSGDLSPVVAKTSGIQFATRDCAICNGVSGDDAKTCDITTQCDDDDEMMSYRNVESVNECSVAVDCGAKRQVCYGPITQTCVVIPGMSDDCYRFSSYVFDAATGITYKNSDCAVCNGISSYKENFCPNLYMVENKQFASMRNMKVVRRRDEQLRRTKRQAGQTTRSTSTLQTTETTETTITPNTPYTSSSTAGYYSTSSTTPGAPTGYPRNESPESSSTTANPLIGGSTTRSAPQYTTTWVDVGGVGDAEGNETRPQATTPTTPKSTTIFFDSLAESTTIAELEVTRGGGTGGGGSINSNVACFLVVGMYLIYIQA